MSDRPKNIVPITPDVRTAAEKFSAEHDRELLTILFTDLVDSTKLQSELGNVEAARLTELHREIVRDELAKYDAREIEWAGDSRLAVFTKPSGGVVSSPPSSHGLSSGEPTRLSSTSRPTGSAF